MPALQVPPAHQRVAAGIAEVAASRAVVLTTSHGYGHLVFAAELATASLMAFAVRYGSGFVSVAMLEDNCARLRLPPMHYYAASSHTASFRVTVDAAEGISTGISARDRARTVRLLADPSSSYEHFTRPGHMVPVEARPRGVLDRCGPAEAALDLSRLAGLRPAGVLCGIVSEQRPTDMAKEPELAAFAATHGLVCVSAADLAAYRCGTEAKAEWRSSPGMATPVDRRAATFTCE